jgi:carbon-monoxide dehydrogenase large subunit
MSVDAKATATLPQYVGARVLRVEDPEFLMGRAKYLDDITLPDMLHAAFVRSPVPHAEIVNVDIEAAQALDGVVAIYTAADIEANTTGPFVTALPRDEIMPVTRPLLASDRVRFVGEPIAVIVATSRYIAEDAAALVEIDFKDLGVVTNAEHGLTVDAVQLHDDVPGNNIAHIEFDSGDVDRVFDEAPNVFSKRFHIGRVTAAPLEGRGVIANYNPGADHLTIWSSTQMPHFARTLLAGTLGMAEKKMRVIAPAVGGGFGVKSCLFPEEAIIPVASRLLARPVKWAEDRQEALSSSAHAKEIIMDLDIAVDDEGTFLAFRGNYVGDAGAYAIFPWTSLVDPLLAADVVAGIYDVRHVSYKVDSVLTNKCPAGPYRATGQTGGYLLRDSLIDDIARAMDIDPVELRLKNCIGNEPYVTATGFRYDGGSYAESIRKVCDMIGYDKLREEQAELRKQGRYLGIGVAPYVEPTAWGSKSAQKHGFPAEFYDSASVTVEPDGSVNVTVGTQSHGQGHVTSLAQVAADQLGVRLEDVKVLDSDSDTAVYGAGTFMSRTAVVSGGSIMRAAADVRERILALAGQELEVNPSDLEISNSTITVKGSPGKSMTVAEVSAVAYFGGERRGEVETLTSTRYYDPPETYSNGVIAAVVEVDVETGHVEMRHFAAVEDCGTMLNPMIIEGQVAGALAQGVGIALLENAVYDEQGQFNTASLMDYLYPSSNEVPTMDLAHLVTPSDVSEGGIKGMGEGGLVGSPVAVVNAVADALSPFGVTINSTPLRPADVLAKIEAAQAGNGGR